MRTLLAWLAIAFAGPACAAGYPPVVPGAALAFPRDHGAHPAYRTEWWYVTGWLQRADGGELGFQVTFFRVRPRTDEANPSRFAPNQILFAHAAISDPALGRLLHDERIARAGFGLAEAAEGTTDVWIDDWRLQQAGEGYRARIAARGFALELALESTRPLLLQGEAGFSRKAPEAKHASYYYSRPQLAVTGTVTREGRREQVKGRAWLDHEWSSELMPEGASGWDWVGANLADGGALMAFRMRDAAGETLWAAGTLRGADGAVRVLRPEEVAFVPLRRWRSPRTGADYPVALELRLPGRRIALAPLFDDQELDARASTGNVYWEGAVRLMEAGREIGRGYLELTGYWRRLEM
jgi:predicted secreted hydrolase